MCGRFTHRYTWRQIHRLLSLTTPAEPELEFRPNYNCAPIQTAPVVRQEGGVRSAAMLKWGLVPFWATDQSIGNTLINARSEEVAGKPAFRAAFKSRRCVVPVSGFYEWKAVSGTGKPPFYITPRATSADPSASSDEGILALAGLWESWRSPEGGETVETFCILTTSANSWMQPLHHRMPVIIQPRDVDLWLDPAASGERLAGLLRPAGEDVLQRWPVSTRVNSPARNDSSMLQPVADPGVSGNLLF